MDISLLDGQTGHLLWVAQTLTVSAVFAMLWLHKKKHIYNLHLSLGFLASSAGAICGMILADQYHLASIASIIAHSFWLCGIFHAQKRKLEPWVTVPPLVYLGSWFLTNEHNSQLILFFGFHTANILGFCLIAITLLTTKHYRSATRKMLSLFLVGYGAILAFLNGLKVCAVEWSIFDPELISFIENAAMLFGLTLIVMLTAKMLIEDTERRLTHLALTDHLTGVYNRRALEKLFKDGQRAPSGDKGFLAITMFDIDHFKKINDQHGHGFGDYVLKRFVEIASARLGAEAHLIRMGGEEFAVITKVKELSEAAQLAERIRIDFGNFTLRRDDKAVRATVSAGIAAQPIESADLYALLSMADRGLYAAKKSGRDRCVIHDDMTSVVIPSSQRDPGDDMETYTDKQVAVLNRIAAIADGHKTAQ